MSQRRHLKTPQAIATALGVPFSERFQLELDELKQWDDWPKETKQGFARDEIIAFYTRNAAKLLAIRNLAQIADPEAKRKSNAQDLKAIQDGGIGVILPEATENLPNVNTQHALAVALQRHFGNRIAIVIDDEAVSSWRHGDRLPEGAVLPPPKNGNYWSAKEWAQWIERYILPHHQPGASTSEDLATAARLKKERVKAELEEIEHDRMMRAVEAGKYIEIGRAENLRRGALKLMVNLHRRLRETENTEARASWLATKLDPHDLLAFREHDMKLEIAAHDRFESELIKLSEETPEQSND